MEITLDNIDEEFEKIVESCTKEVAIKWFRQRLVEIIANPNTNAFNKQAASASLAIFNEFYSDSLN